MRSFFGAHRAPLQFLNGLLTAAGAAHLRFERNKDRDRAQDWMKAGGWLERK